MVKYYANLVPQYWFIFTKEVPQPIWQGDSTPPPYGKIPVEHVKSLRGASLSGSDQYEKVGPSVCLRVRQAFSFSANGYSDVCLCESRLLHGTDQRSIVWFNSILVKKKVGPSVCLRVTQAFTFSGPAGMWFQCV